MKSENFHFNVKGQEGDIPQISLGTASLNGEECIKSVELALKLGYRGIDTALLYNNQEEIGIALKNINLPREKYWVTSKVGFSPAGGENDLLGLYSEKNIKGVEAESIELSLKQLQLEYVDLMLVHTPVTTAHEYNAACSPHFFEFFNSRASPKALPIADREKFISQKRNESLQQKDAAAARKIRESSWAAMELALEQQKCRFIGVSNYPVELIIEMKEYAKIMPAVNQLEFHPKYASPELRRVCKELGIVLVGYGTGTFVSISEKYLEPDYNIILEISKRMRKTPNQIVLRWTTQQGVGILPRSRSEEHQIENLTCNSFDLSPEDMELLNGLNADCPYYWDPVSTVQTL